MPIYRGFDIQNYPGDAFPYKVYRGGIYVYAARSENDAMNFIDKTIKEERGIK
jgi:hypothetical protein